MANTIELAKLYLGNLQTIWKKRSLSAVLENDALVRTFAGASADEVKLPKMELDGLGNYSRTSGYALGSVSLSWETRKLTQDRGKKFTLDAMDDFESISVAGGQILSEFERTKVVPDVDAYRFSKIAQGSITANRAFASINTGALAKDAFETANFTLDDAEVPKEGRYLFCTPSFLKELKSAFDSNRFYTSGEGNVNRQINLLDGVTIVEVPQSRLYVGYTATENGYTTAGSAINFILVHKDAVLPVIKHNPVRIFDPSVNQDADSWVFNYRIYHDCFVMPNKASGIYLHTATDYATS